MDRKVLDCLENKQGSYILPFLWLHGEDKERIREEILAIKNSGISEFCAESRPYEKFCQEEWWEDFGFILKTARELNMKVWLLDDKKFPTGYANGYLERKDKAHLRKRLIREYPIDVVGPMKNAKVFVGGRVDQNDEVIRVVAFRHKGEGEELDFETGIDLTSTLKDGMVYWDIPAGEWRVCVTAKSNMYEHINDRFFYYIDMLNPDSCHAMIDAIYEPHYKHFEEYFGNTFMGFFSDEPGFLNMLDTYHNTLGIMYSPYPWRDDLPELIAKSAQVSVDKIELCIPALWENLGEITSLIRTHYMEVVTKLYSENFCYMLGNWCREHGVMYIGHVIEDMGAHKRLAYGSGHYFRALDGQDMGGMDIVLMQDVPGITECIHRAPLADGGKAEPQFFRYTLPKLASSHSHIQPLKKGRAMCEIFGAFGWAEGLSFMKGLADIMLVRGINRFVPHAFSPTEEDKDCPPHFYNGNRNIQYPLFKRLMEYMGRCVHILADAKHKCDVAVFYNAEGEWSGKHCQDFSKICKKLTQGLVDFDIVPYDALEKAEIVNNRLLINGEDYGALVVSESESLPISRINCFENLAKKGLPVIFTNSLPKESAEGIDVSSALIKFRKVALESLVSYLRCNNLCHVDGKGEGIKSLCFYHAVREEKDIYLFSNEGINDVIDAQIFLKNAGECLIYDPWDNKCYREKAENGELKLRLEKGNMLFVIFGCQIPENIPVFSYEAERKELPIQFDISVKEEGESEYKLLFENSPLFDISAPDKYPYFSGNIRYEANVELTQDYTVLDLGQVGEVAEVWLNGVYLGARINSPYKFSMANQIITGKNKLEIVVKSNLAHFRRDGLSSYTQIPPSGILGGIFVCKYK